MMAQKHKQLGSPYSLHDLFLLLGEIHWWLPKRWLHISFPQLVTARSLSLTTVRANGKPGVILTEKGGVGDNRQKNHPRLYGVLAQYLPAESVGLVIRFAAMTLPPLFTRFVQARIAIPRPKVR